MSLILKSLLKKLFLILLVLLLLTFVFIFLNNFLIKKLNSVIEERNNILRTINQNLKKQTIASKINSKIREIEEKYKINFSEFKNNLLSQNNIPLPELQNKIINLAKDNNLDLKIEGADQNILKFSLTGNFNDLKQFEKMIKLNKIRLKLDSIRIFPRGNNYLFEIETSLF